LLKEMVRLTQAVPLDFSWPEVKACIFGPYSICFRRNIALQKEESIANTEDDENIWGRGKMGGTRRSLLDLWVVTCL
jgi:hypothetical protein